MGNKVICGIKLTHDGAIALIDGAKLIFSIEFEKLNNNPRFSSIDDLESVYRILGEWGYNLTDVEFVIDGWAGLTESWIDTFFMGKPVKLQVATYRETKLSHNVLASSRFVGLPQSDNDSTGYASYMHVTGHIAGAYCTSPFASKSEGSYVLVWDGGMFPRLYYFEPNDRSVKNMGDLFFLTGNFYAVFASYFSPFNTGDVSLDEERSIPGKVMAYIAKGRAVPEIIAEFDDIYLKHLDLSMGYAHQFVQIFKSRTRDIVYSDEDVLTSMHFFLEKLLITSLREKLKRYNFPHKNICFAGGCALNIKWNSAIRNSGIFDAMWVPPFPNDSGSAIGVACARMLDSTSHTALEWNVFSGPAVIKTPIHDDWISVTCNTEQLALLLANSNLPVILLHGRAELGPRALGGRSIIGSATHMSMKNILNDIKIRESYRPVAPICLEEEAPLMFDPGVPDPLMLYDHMVRDSWKDKVPAICHLDGSARLQTVNKYENITVYNILTEYKKLTGIPVLCNTSANFKGKGFFPDVRSAMDWGRVPFIWSDNILSVKKGFESHLDRIVLQAESI